MIKNNKVVVKEDDLLMTIIEGLEEVKGIDIAVMDLRELESAMSNYFVLCSGTSTTQVEALARKVEEFTHKGLNERPRRVEGVRNAQWVLMDYFTVVVHIFHEPIRLHYNLEELWSDAKEWKLKKKTTRKKKDE
ncbi:MAG: ribosome silencing factor [Bacteroidota bacterium]